MRRSLVQIVRAKNVPLTQEPISMSTWTFKTDKGRRWHTGAVLYSLMAYGTGWWLLLSQNWIAFLPGILLLGHGMIIAAYLIHECAHNTIFTDNRHNNQLAG